MKLPPLALVAPSLCPRCDQPAMVVMDHSEESRCGHCGLQLHHAGLGGGLARAAAGRGGSGICCDCSHATSRQAHLHKVSAFHRNSSCQG
jgi:hypothetical protein